MSVSGYSFEFGMDCVSDKTPAGLGEYIAGMPGTRKQKTMLVGFVSALQRLTAGDEAIMEAGFEARMKLTRQ